MRIPTLFVIVGYIKIETLLTKSKNHGEVKRLLEAICNLKKDTYDSILVKQLLLEIFNKYFQSNLGTAIRSFF